MPRFPKALLRAASLVDSVVRPDSLLGAGAEAPSFDLPADDGSRVKSADLLGNRHYVLVFYPGDKTPGCTLQLRQFSALVPRFAEEDCLVFGVNPADASSHASFCDSAGLQVRLLVDEGRRLAVAFRTARPGVPRTFRAVVVVDKRGIVRATFKDFPDPDAVLRMVERCNETGYKGTGRKGRQLVPEVSGFGVRKLQESDPTTRVLDIREVADFAAGHIPGAIHIPIDDLVPRMGELPDRDTPLVVCCDQGLRASGAARILKDSGWRKLYTLQDGMEAWRGDLERA